jgi:hypothetical protein
VLLCRLGGVVVSVIATGLKGRRFKPGRGYSFLRAIKIRSTPSFEWEAKPQAPCRNILRHVKDSFVHSSYSLPHVSAGRIARELWWTSQEFSLSSIIITMALPAHIHTGDEQ